MEDSAHIVVQRRKGGYRDFVRRYCIEVDGTRAGSVARGGDLTIPVAAGVHAVRAVIDWTGSPTLEVEAGSMVRLLVEPGGNGFQLWHLWQEDRYLKLAHE